MVLPGGDSSFAIIQAALYRWEVGLLDLAYRYATSPPVLAEYKTAFIQPT